MVKIKQNKICKGDYDFLTFFDNTINSVTSAGEVFLESSNNHLKVYFNYTDDEEVMWKSVDIQLGSKVISDCRCEVCPNPDEYIETDRIIIPYIFEILLKGYTTNNSIEFQYKDLRFEFVGSLKDEYFRTDRFGLTTTFEEFVMELQNSLKNQYQSIEKRISTMSDEEVENILKEKKIIYSKEFERVNKVRILKIPRTIKTVEEDGLSYMPNVKAVVFESNETLNNFNNVLNHCEDVQLLVFHEGLERLINSGNYCKELQQVKLPKSLQVLKNCFAESEKLEEIFIPCNVRYVDNFCNCEKLEAINVDNDNQKYASYDGCLYSKDLKILYSCPPAKESICIHRETEVIAEYAMNNCQKLQEVKLPSGLKEIQQYAFVRSNIPRKALDIPVHTVVHPTAFNC